ncbi:hypothetical protein ACO0K3_19500, partial [Undibacterium sp. Rencai35W]|uniref:hypothetical protein n=1 Tax=Undibacterium sp. Rencai35W TaxID=3413046 RepID=UPI003BF2E9D2
AGMGDVIFASLYELLKQRGVKFEFFHQLQQLTPGADDNGQHCVATVLLQQHNINLESFWSDWPGCYETHFGASLPTKTLQFKEDFDRLILGVSVAS